MRISDWSSDVCSSDLASVEWQRSDITLAGVFTYIGGSTDDRIQPTVNVESFKSFDIIARTSLSQKHGPLKGVSINFSVLNVFNAKPPYIRTTSPIGYHYDSTNFPTVGRFVSFTVSKAL